MKRKLNKKNILITIVAVIVFMIVILGISKLVPMNIGNKSSGSTDEKNIKVEVEFTNLCANIKWNKLPEYSNYEILRKISTNENYVIIADVKSEEVSDDGRVCEYKDIYCESLKSTEEKKLLAAKTFIDPSVNSLIYTVRGYEIKDGIKEYTDYSIDGDFHLEAPSIISVEENDDGTVSIEWGCVENAKEYYVYSGIEENNDISWKKIANVEDRQTVRLKTKLTILERYDYLTVKAVGIKDEELIFSDYDKGFSLKNRDYSNKKILFFGDSITFGSPYKSKNTREVFSYPYRVHQLTGADFYNPSIPGSTYTYSDRTNRSRMIQIADCLREGRNVTKSDLTKSSDMYVYETNFCDNQINDRKFSDFDVIIMAAGTNDYLDDAIFGDLNSNNIQEMNGSLNTIISYIKEANAIRNQEGKENIKIVFVDFFYSDRTYDYTQKTNRFITKNKIGLTLTDYQNNINSLVSKYKDEGLDIYQFNTSKLINQENCPYASSDNLHMTKFTYTQIGNELSNYLITNGVI